MLCIGYAKSVPDEGFSPRRQTPHPSAMLRIAATLSHKGGGEESASSSPQLPPIAEIIYRFAPSAQRLRELEPDGGEATA